MDESGGEERAESLLRRVLLGVSDGVELWRVHETVAIGRLLITISGARK